MELVKPTPYYEAIDKIGDKTPIGSAMMSAEWSDVPVALRERAMFSSQVENIRFLQRGRDSITDFLSGALEDTPGGPALATGGRAQFIEQMRAFALAEGMGDLTGQVTAGGLRDILSERRLGLIFDVQTRQGDDYGYWRQGMQEDVLNEFPAQRFIRVQEVKQERELHKPFENQVYLKNDPVWARVINKDFGVPWGPWGWGCGHDVEDVDRDEAEQLGLVKPGQRVEPDVKNFNENLRASANGLDPDLLDKLKSELGDQLVIGSEGEMRWRASDESEPKAESPKPEIEQEVTKETKSQGNKNPVSAALELKVPKWMKAKMQAAIEAIDAVHDDGTLPKIRVVPMSKTNALGGFAHEGGKAVRIEINRDGKWPEFTAVHEIGHFLDLEAIGAKGALASKGDPVLRPVMDVIRRTDVVKELRAKFAAAQPGTFDYDKYEYFLRPQELWARAYSQFIAERSGGVLETQLADRFTKRPLTQWSKEDFKPVADEIEKLFKKLWWM